jgi:predicted ATPase
VALFVERARAVVSSFQLGPANAEAIRVRLSDRLILLTGGRRDVPDRHQTLREAIGWSYDLLDVAERTFFRRIAVFAGGFTLDGAQAVVRDEGRWRAERDRGPGDEESAFGPLPALPSSPDLLISSSVALDLLAALVDKNLLVVETQADGEPRFRMLETIRAFGIEQLAECGELDATRRATRAISWHWRSRRSRG